MKTSRYELGFQYVPKGKAVFPDGFARHVVGLSSGSFSAATGRDASRPDDAGQCAGGSAPTGRQSRLVTDCRCAGAGVTLAGRSCSVSRRSLWRGCVSLCWCRVDYSQQVRPTHRQATADRAGLESRDAEVARLACSRSGWWWCCVVSLPAVCRFVSRRRRCGRVGLAVASSLPECDRRTDGRHVHPGETRRQADARTTEADRPVEPAAAGRVGHRAQRQLPGHAPAPRPPRHSRLQEWNRTAQDRIRPDAQLLVADCTGSVSRTRAQGERRGACGQVVSLVDVDFCLCMCFRSPALSTRASASWC